VLNDQKNVRFGAKAEGKSEYVSYGTEAWPEDEYTSYLPKSAMPAFMAGVRQREGRENAARKARQREARRRKQQAADDFADYVDSLPDE
jgi:hypothetical protein